MQLITSNLVKENNDIVLRAILQEILEITMKNPIFRDVTKEAIILNLIFGVQNGKDIN